MNAKFRVAAIALPFFIAGLVGGTRAVAEDRYGLASQPQVYLVHQTAKNTFLVQSAGYRAASVLGPAPISSMMQANESASLQQKLDLQDPVNYLKDRLAETLRRQLALTNLEVQSSASDLPILPDGLSEEARAANTPTYKDKHPTGAVIEVVTRHWGIDNYKMKYFASVWVTDLGKSKRLMSGSCPWVIFDQVQKAPASGGFDQQGRYRPVEDAPDPSAAEAVLFADNGALLKANLRKAAEQCADKIAERFIK